MSSVIFPELGLGRFSARPEEVLLLCYYDPLGISTVPETVACLQAKSQFSVSVLNLFEHRQSFDGLELSPSLRLDRFAAVIIHNTVSYNVDNLRSLDRMLPARLSQFDGVKVLMKQDENYRFREMARYIGDASFDVVFTCLPPDEVSKIYPAKLAGTPRFVRMLTGYITPTLRSIAPSSDKRPVDIGYRGSIQPLSFGRLAFEKRKIGDDVESLLTGTDLSLDISSRWEDRIGGAGWLKFLASCKATLGAESGASVFDLDGDLDSRCCLAEEKLGAFRIEHDYAESYLNYLRDIEGNVYYNQVSPRHFEAIATQTLQLLYPGGYSEILQPGRHYFPLERDYSNLQEAINLLRDEARRKEIVSCAYEEILLNKKYWIETFVQNVDDEISTLLESKGKHTQAVYKSNETATNVLLIAAHEPRIDPRLDWIASCAPHPLKVHQCGVLLPDRGGAIRDTTPNGGLYQARPRMSYVPGAWAHWLRLVNGDPSGVAAVQEMIALEQTLQLPENEFAELFAAPPGCERIMHFRWYLRYLLDTSETLLNSCLEMRGIHAIIATDLDTLLPALVLKGIFKIPAFYDAHEYWAESDVNSFEFERAYWVALERRLVAHTDYRQIVSPGLAKLLSEQYHYSFDCLPNCEPVTPSLVSTVESPKFQNAKGKCSFLFQGGFSKGRGFEPLIEAWSRTNENALLLLRGKDNPYKSELIKLANETGLLGTRIFFPDAVDEIDMIRAASEFDVGIAPYPPTNILYEHCSPNKISQYMAAGLPILANDTNFVREILTKGQCGIVINFLRVNDLVSAVDRLTLDKQLRDQLATSGREFYLTTFNWQKLSGSFYKQLLVATSGRQENLIVCPLQKAGYYSKPQDLITIATEKAYSAIAGDDSAAPRAEMTKNVLRPIWQRLPESLRKRLRAAMLNKI